MSQKTTTETSQKTALNSIKIVDAELIKKIDAEMVELFISKEEQETLDDDVIEEGRLIKSAEEIGGQYIPIAVAYCPTDPTMQKKLDGKDNPNYNPESYYRVHGRIIDGRHRYLNAKGSGTKWDITYFNIKDFDHYAKLRKHLDQKKTPNKKENEVFFEQVCKHKFEVLGIPIEDICKLVVDEYANTMSKPAIRSYIPSQYKDSKMAAIRQGATKELEETVAGKKIAEKLKKKTGKELSKKDKEIEKLHTEETENLNKIIDLETLIKGRDEIVKEYNDLQPFLSAVHTVKVEGADMQVEVKMDLTKKEIIVKQIK